MDDKKYCVYKHTSPSGKVYIGRTGQLLHERSRYDGSGYKGNTSFYNAIQKYGWENFEKNATAIPLALDGGLRSQK